MAKYTVKRKIKQPPFRRTDYSIWIIGIVVVVLALIIGYYYNSHTVTSNDTVEEIKIPNGWSVLEIAESNYGKLIAFQGPQFRLLLCGRSFLGGIWEDDYLSSVFTTFPIESAVYFANPSGTHLLQIGLGIGIVARMISQFAHDVKIHTDAVDINLQVIQMAQKHFSFHHADYYYVEDGRDFIFRTDKKYDFIVHDIYSAGMLSPHLMTIEVFQRIKEMLNEKGVLCFSFVGYESKIPFKSAWKTLSQAFPHIRAFKAGEDEGDFANMIIFASSTPIQFKIPSYLKSLEKSKLDSFWTINNFQSFEFVPKDDPNAFLITEDNLPQVAPYFESVEHELKELVEQVIPVELHNLFK